LHDNRAFDEPDRFIPMGNAARLNAIGVMRSSVARRVDIRNSRAIFVAARENRTDVFAPLSDERSSCMANGLIDRRSRMLFHGPWTS
jgi:hypothetical protein